MLRSVLIPAILTGAFCSVFAITVDAILDMVGMYAVAGIAATSGFLGSLFASFVTGKHKK